MTHEYVSNKIVTAWPQEKDGAEGYGVKYESGHISWSPKEIFEKSSVSIGNIAHLPPHQQRVLAEKVQLDARIKALKSFLAMPVVVLPPYELQLMNLQLGHMEEYSKILDLRIGEFGITKLGMNDSWLREKIEEQQAGDSRTQFQNDWTAGPDPIPFKLDLKAQQVNAYALTDPNAEMDSTDSLNYVDVRKVFDSVGNVLPFTTNKVEGTPVFMNRFAVTGPEFDFYVEANLQRGTVEIVINQAAPGLSVEFIAQRINHNRRQG